LFLFYPGRHVTNKPDTLLMAAEFVVRLRDFAADKINTMSVLIYESCMPHHVPQLGIAVKVVIHCLVHFCSSMLECVLSLAMDLISPSAATARWTP
jgi:hypothetical protein